MKKLILALICILPATGFAQPVIKQISLPKLAFDNTTKLRTLLIVQTAPGAGKEKLAAVLGKWLASKYTVLSNGKTAGDTSATAINGEGILFGSCPISRLQRDPNATDRVATNQAPVDYKIDFNIKFVVTAGSYAVTIDHIKLEYLNVITPIEPFYNGNAPHVLIPAEDRGLDEGEMYNHMFSDINLHLGDIAKSTSKYIAKAQKKGDL